MNRLHKKCVIASAGIHGLLLLILFIGPAFVSEQVPPDDMPILEFIPLKTTDELISGGGNPNARPPAANLAELPPPKPVVEPPVTKPAEPEPLPEPKPEPKRQPDPKPEPVKPLPPREPDPDSLELNQKPKPKPLKISTELVTRKPSESEKKAEEAKAAEARKRERQAAEARRKIARAIGSMANNLESGLSSSTTVELRGPGGGGIPYANFLQAVKSIYSRAWTVPDGVADDDATAEATVTIARDGTVLSFKIIKSSGNGQVDRSVESLDRIRRAVPLPDDAREDERTVNIKFNVRARRALN